MEWSFMACRYLAYSAFVSLVFVLFTFMFRLLNLFGLRLRLLGAKSIYNERRSETIGGGLNCSWAFGSSRLRTEKAAGIGVCLMAAALKDSESFLVGPGKGSWLTTPKEGVEKLTFQRAVQKRLDARRARPEEWGVHGSQFDKLTV